MHLYNNLALSNLLTHILTQTLTTHLLIREKNWNQEENSDLSRRKNHNFIWFLFLFMHRLGSHLIICLQGKCNVFFFPFFFFFYIKYFSLKKICYCFFFFFFPVIIVVPLSYTSTFRTSRIFFFYFVNFSPQLFRFKNTSLIINIVKIILLNSGTPKFNKIVLVMLTIALEFLN